MKKLEGKVAVITGGNSGIGLATAQQFVTDGAYVFITGRRQSELDAAVVEIGKNVTGVRGDVSNLADLDRLYSTVKKEKDQIDILFEIYNQETRRVSERVYGATTDRDIEVK
jgi:NAD(P)-dependent dehydrogenase (short-subunit alcohol dehydrogenase family)